MVLKDGRVGQVKWRGLTEEKSRDTTIDEVRYGVRLTEPFEPESEKDAAGKESDPGDGRFEGKQRFLCPLHCAVFVSAMDIMKCIERGFAYSEIHGDTGTVCEADRELAGSFDFTHEPYGVNDRVRLKDGRLGQVKYVSEILPDMESGGDLLKAEEVMKVKVGTDADDDSAAAAAAEMVVVKDLVYGIRLVEPDDSAGDGTLAAEYSVTGKAERKFESPPKCGTYVAAAEIVAFIPADSVEWDFSDEPYYVCQTQT